MAETCLVFFRSGACDLDGAARSLAASGLTVDQQEDHLLVGRPSGPRYLVGLNASPWVREEASEIAAGTPHENLMRECDARFEIVIDDLAAALDEINTLMEVQGGLQEACRGFLFLTWNGSLTAPGSD